MEQRKIEKSLRASASGRAHAAAQIAVSDQAPERGRQRGGIAWRDDEAGLTVHDELGHAADGRGHDRKTGGHRLENGDREPLGPAGEDEGVRSGKQFADVEALAEALDDLAQPEPSQLGLYPVALGPIAHDESPKGRTVQMCQRTNERQQILRCFQPADGDERRHSRRMARARRSAHVDGVADHDHLVAPARPRFQPERALVLRDADDASYEPPSRPLGSQVELREEARVAGERPAVDGEDANGDAGDARSEAAQHSGLRAVRVHDVRPLTPAEPNQLEEPKQIAPRAQRTSHVSESDEASPGLRSRVPKGPGPVRRVRHVEPVDKRGKKMGYVGLSTSDLREGDDD